MLSKNPKDYIIVTKEAFLVNHGATTQEHADIAAKMLEDQPQGTLTTFWIVSKDGEYIQRYSIDSCPKWVKFVYRELTKEKDNV